MTGIEILKKEHENILKFTDELEEYFIEVLDGKSIDIHYLNHCINFIREYADGHHHQKEEDYLFKVMLSEFGDLASKVITNGMMVEHDLNRLVVSQLDEAVDNYEKEPSTKNKLDIIGNAMTYIYQIRRHIEKEDEVVFNFANRSLSEEGKDWVNEKSVDFENKNHSTIEKYSMYTE